MRKNGFTLIELLAVIVILAIIALIAVPIVLNIIEDTKNSAIIRSADFYLDSVELSIAEAILDGGSIDGSYTVSDNGNICKTEGNCITVEVSGDTPDSGSTITIANGQISNISLRYDNKTVIKNTYGSLVFADNGDDNNNNVSGPNGSSGSYDNGSNNNVNSIDTTTNFYNDSWETIVSMVKGGDAAYYDVGNEKYITLTSDDEDVAGTYKVRIANNTTPDQCSTEGFSQAACGFVIEFVDIIKTHKMKEEQTTTGNWQTSDMKTYVNGTIYEALPDIVKNNIIPTSVVSGTETPDKLYLLSINEVNGGGQGTRKLDYYSSSGATKIKYLNGTETAWWLRSSHASDVLYFDYISSEGESSIDDGYANSAKGLAPAFRLGPIEEDE